MTSSPVLPKLSFAPLIIGPETAHALGSEIGADVDRDMILFLDLISKRLDLLFEEGGHMLSTGDAGEPFFHWIDRRHEQGW